MFCGKVAEAALQRCFLGKDVLEICSEFTGEHKCRNVNLIKLYCNFIEITLRHECSAKNLLRTFGSSKSTFREKLLKLALRLFYGMEDANFEVL